ncbi:MAG: hypothetical protein ACXWAC_09120 [Usitatibacter sp.]
MDPDEKSAATTLAKALPQLVLGIEDSLIRIGRGGVADQLRVVTVDGWDYDEYADVATLRLRAPPGSSAVDRGMVRLGRSETISLHDDLPVNVEVDDRGRLVRLEILDAKAILPQLEGRVAR